MRSTLPISVCVIAFNEEGNIGACLASVQWADDLLVVDSGSSDRTCVEAEGWGARILFNEWPGHKEQKQFATENAQYDWVLSLDADERVTPELADSIGELFKEGAPDPKTGFTVNRLNHYLGIWHWHGSFYPDIMLRLYNRQATQWGGDNPHDKVLSPGKTQRLKGYLLHWPYQDISDHLSYIDRYTSIMAKDKVEAGVRMPLFKAIFHPPFKFFRDYFLKRGLLDGKAGFVNAALGSYYNFLKYAKVWERKKGRNRKGDE